MTEADIENVLSKIGRVGVGASEAEGEDRAARAAQAAIVPILTDGSIGQASGVLVEIAGGIDLTEAEVDVVGETVHRAADPEADILVGPAVRESKLAGAVKVTVFAISFDE